MEWPSLSPDLNQVENLWVILNKDVPAACPETADELKRCVRKAFKAVEDQTLHNLIESFPKRCKAVMDAKGEKCKY